MSIKPAQRRKARHYAVQAMYQWQMTANDLADIEDQFIVSINPKKVDVAYFLELIRGTLKHLDVIDDAIEGHIDRKLEEVDPVERAIIRLAAFELTERAEIPYRVVINEALELAKVFGAEEGHKYVNGVLDKVAKQLRPLEMAR